MNSNKLLIKLSCLAVAICTAQSSFANEPWSQDRQWLLGDWNGQRQQLEQHLARLVKTCKIKPNMSTMPHTLQSRSCTKQIKKKQPCTQHCRKFAHDTSEKR